MNVTGITMVWKKIENSNYVLNERGEVKNIRTGYKIKYQIDNKGYARVKIVCNGKGKSYKIHKLVARYFIGETPIGCVVSHKDNDKLNNRLENLEYITQTENSKRAYDDLLFDSILEKNDIKNIIILYVQGLSPHHIAKLYGVSRNTIRDILRGKTWKSVTKGNGYSQIRKIYIKNRDVLESVDIKDEVWKQIHSNPNYLISSVGRVKRISSSKILKPKISADGYLIIGIGKKMYSLHNLVAREFIGPCPDKYQLNHKDGNKKNNKVDNLEYVTQSENIKHRFKIKNGGVI